MRYACFLLILPLLDAGAHGSEESTPSLAARMPPGAVFYVRAGDLAGSLDLLWNSPALVRARNHPLAKALTEGQQARQLFAGLQMVKAISGYEPEALLRALLGREIALAVYAPDEVAGRGEFLLLARVDAAAAEKLLGALRMVSAMAGGEAAPGEGERPAILGLGRNAFGYLEGDLLVLASTLDRARASRDGQGGLDASDAFRSAHAVARGDESIFAYLSLASFAKALRPENKPKEVLQALFVGPALAYAASAPVACFGLTLRREGNEVALELSARVPSRAGLPPEVASMAGGSLEPLPFALPPTTLAVMRMRRDLGALWEHREELLSEGGIAGMVEFETNFGTISAGMSFVDDLLPELRPELTFVATRPVFEPGAPVPEVRYPQFALLIPLRDAAKVAPDLKMAFQSAIVFLSAASVQEKGRGLRLALRSHAGVDLLTATYAPPTDGEMEGRSALPVRYNFAPSCAEVDGWFLIASSPRILTDIIDGRGQGTGEAPGANAGLWIDGREAAQLLRENREALVTQSILKEGKARAAAEMQTDLLLDLARHVESLSLVFAEEHGEAGLRLTVRLGSAGE
ncbi:MAG: hypothetical protein ACT4PV_03600 [Planctomycetaceae bacterium]